MTFFRMIFTSVLCVMLVAPVWADNGDEYRRGGQAVSHGLTGTGNTKGGSTNTAASCNKVEHIGNSCTSNTGTGKCNCQRYEGKGSAKKCVAVGCSVKQCNKGLNFQYNQFEDGKQCLFGAKSQQASVEDEDYPLYKGIKVTICGSKGFCGSRPRCSEGQVAPKLKLSDGTIVFAGCYDVSTFTRTCPSGQIFEDENSTKCIPCKSCDATNANCKENGSNGVDTCYYNTSCKSGYGDAQHSGEYKNEGKYNPECTPNVYRVEYEMGPGLQKLAGTMYTYGEGLVVDDKPTRSGYIFVGWCTDAKLQNCALTQTISTTDMGDKIFYAKWEAEAIPPEQPEVPEPCDVSTIENAETVERIDGECKATKCKDKYILQNGRCVQCPDCEPGANAQCEVSSNGLDKCIYKTSCDTGYHSTAHENEYNPECEKNAPDEYSITYELDNGSGCDDAPRKYKVGTETVVNCQPTKEGFEIEGWVLDETYSPQITMPYTIPADATGDKKFIVGWKATEKPQTECTDKEKKKFPHADQFKFEDGKCEPIHCEEGYDLDKEKNECKEKDKPRTECTDEEKEKFPHADEFKFEDGKCEPIHCEKGYKLEKGECVDDGIKEAEDNYKKAKETETSFENRMLGGLTMAATGIGGMELAQGLAEKSADEAAERDMTAYLATFKCKVGDQRYSGGTMSIETPGANQLTNLYQEYVELATDLKERKTALGMKAGIESEVILDKNNIGLYDDVGHGIENGTYASLYRASRGNENDIKKLEEQKNTSANRVKGGAIAAGAGVVGGIVGNIAINGGSKADKTDKDKEKTSKKEIVSKKAVSDKTTLVVGNRESFLKEIEKMANQ